MRSIWSSGIASSARRADRRRSHAQAVDQHQRLAGVGAAQERAGRGAGTAVDRDLDAGLPLQQLRQALRAAAQDFVGLDDRQVGEQIGDRLWRPRCRHDDRIEHGRLGRRSGLRVRRNGGDGGGKYDETNARCVTYALRARWSGGWHGGGLRVAPCIPARHWLMGTARRYIGARTSRARGNAASTQDNDRAQRRPRCGRRSGASQGDTLNRGAGRSPGLALRTARAFPTA